ncbi:AAA family ATPase [Cupriavidus pauculus]|uniref:AAA family ATPase n=1 Tax=Cupriavidus pauculus TaxID=82633 RepID=A0A2N5C936_9BURK|nr:AAA family ATPase [Cupriavidus pauculus]PLP98704.1 hypothetical protein CYJ10_20605 [Cupriavidus pauculus]
MTTPEHIEQARLLDEARDGRRLANGHDYGGAPALDDEAPRLYPLLTAGEMAAKPLPRWLVRNLINETGVGMIYGESGSLKSYLALHLAYAVADGDPHWFGFKVKQAPVIYLCLEGNAGFGMRIRAMQATRHGDHENLRFLDGGTFCLDDDENVLRLAQSIKAAHCAPGTLVIIDTLACASGMADENSTRDARMLIQAARRLAWSVGGFVLIVHHTGKDVANGPRGGSNFRADTDVVIRVVKASEESNGVGYWESVKVKDARDGGRFGFVVEWSVVTRDDEGQDVTSGVVVPTDQPVEMKDTGEPKHRRGRPPAGGENQKLVLNTIRTAMGNRTQIHQTAAISAAVQALQLADKPRPGDRAREAIKSLCDSGALTRDGEFFWLGENTQPGVES